ncbi:ATP-binding protein [Ornithinimicrobium tianjinense]|uniref:YhaN AAA domain-containing protein n=1 Tax=Ornithinimicrobium tianjinense TaxID=1195761 RepID=A0A917BDM0_9MICO|nr:ATP-binding protein [Ornithinimicrobium tianjinense]GGF38380.1 hypothetical protein GCM10011366_02440 [Ornithinimicrobium tianjinense]
MRLHRLTLRDVKGVRERTVDLPDEGVVVLEGPNEVGKTTMLEAFDALLRYKASSRAAEVRALQPVDRDEAPFVEAEFTVGSTRLRFAKRWLRQPSTTLHVLSGRPEQLTGDQAQQRVDALLQQHLDRTLFDALRYTQAGDGTVAPLVASTVLTEALDAAAGASQHADGADAILDAVEKEYRLYFTPTGRPTGDYRAAMTRHTQAQQDVVEAHRRVEEARELLDRHQAARRRVAEVEPRLAAAQAALEQAEDADARVELVVSAHREAVERSAQAQELHRAAERGVEQRRALAQEQQDLAASLARARAAQQQDARAAEVRGTASVAAEEELARAATAVEESTVALDEARAHADHLADVRELASVEELFAHTTALVGDLDRAREALPARPVTRETARGLRRLQDRYDALVAQHSAATPVVEVESLGASIEVTVGQRERGTAVGAGERGRVSVSHDTTVEIPGQARLRIFLHEEALGRASEIHGLQEQLAAALSDLGAADVDGVDALADATEAAESAVRERQGELGALLRPFGAAVAAEAARGAVPGAIDERVELARRRVREHRQGLGDRPGQAEQGEALPSDEPAARAAVDRATAALRAARERHRAAGSVAATTRQEVAALTRRLDHAQGRIDADSARWEALGQHLASVRAERPDDQLVADAQAWAERARAAAVQVSQAEAALVAADVAAVRAALSRARDEVQSAAAERDDARAALHTLAGQVEMVAGEGRQELYDLAVADLGDAERELRAVDRRARAARHLRESLTQHRDAAHRLYVRPYTQAIEQLGQRVYGPSFRVTVAEDLSLAARTVDGVTVPYAQLSGGAKEQLGILARLAVARLVDPEHGVPVVIDDALGYSDPVRLRQMSQVLGAADGDAAGVQVILLTCTPERYASIPHVRTVRLTA